jgi:hypothetical protein
MLHVDEGALHAYLDGALDEYPTAEADRIRSHLEACAECAERMGEERRVRSDAHALLGLAAPAVEAPDFEELRAYVERTRGAGMGVSTRVYRLRWAASILVALGTGWLLRGGVPGPATPMPEAVVASSGADDMSAPARADADGPSVTRVEPLVSAPSTVAAGRTAPTEPDPSAAKTEDAGSARARAAFAQSAAPPAPSGQPAGAPTAVVEAEISSAQVAEAEISSAQVAEAQVSALPEAELRASADAEIRSLARDESLGGAGVRSLEANTSADMEPSATDAVESPAALDDRAALAARESADEVDTAEAGQPGVEDQVDEEAERLQRAPTMVTALEQDAFAPRRSVDEEVEPVTDEPSLVVPGYDVLSVTNLGRGTASLGVHVVQRLADGSTFEIYHLEPEVERDVVPSAGPARNEVRVRTEGGWIVLQGPLPRSELEELLARLFPTG